MAKREPDLPFDLTGCSVTQIEWPRRGFRMILGGKTAGGLVVEGARLTFEDVADYDPLHTFLTARLTYSRSRKGYSYDSTEVRLPAKLTDLHQSWAKRASFGDRVYTSYYGTPKVGRGERVFLFALSAPRFRDRPAFPIICQRVALVAANGAALSGAETTAPPMLPRELLEELACRFAVAVIDGKSAVANRLLAPRARRRLGKRGFKRLLPRGFATTRGSAREEAAAMWRESLHVEVAEDATAADGSFFARVAPEVPPNAVRGVAVVYPYSPEYDADPLYTLYFVGEDDDPRIGHVEPY